MPRVNNTADIGAKMETLSSEEKNDLQRSMRRTFEDLRVEGEAVIRNKIQSDYMDEIEVAAQIARHELNGSFDGYSPASGNFGIDVIHPGYFGYDDWDNMPDVTGGSTFDWFDDDTPDNLNSGESGFANPLTIGDPAVHIILGYGSYSPDPVVSRLREQKNDNPIPAVTTEDVFRNTDLRIKWKDTATVLQPQDTFAVRGFAGGENGTDYPAALYPIGLTFLEAQEYRLLDPEDMAGTSENDVVVET
jgi:hypothetical protein